MAVRDTSRKPYIIDNDSNIKVGIDLPIRRDDAGHGWFASSTTTIEAVKNNIRNLLNTNKGERLMQPNLGLNLRSQLFEQIDEENLISIQNSILDTFQFWLPFVEVRNIELLTNADDIVIGTNQISIKILFNIIQDPNTLSSVTVDFTSDIGENLETTQGGGGY
jgi:phage baseplate assembly protein W|tara:strand:- start:277 stop:768 length:492 start_codon:yes stop_codon:yes gene_type:complete